MTADLNTDEYLAFSTGVEALAASPIPSGAQIMHRYGRVSIGNAQVAPAPEPSEAEATGAAEPGDMTTTEQMGTAAFNLRRSQEYTSSKSDRPYAGRSWGYEEGEGPLAIHLADDDADPTMGAEALAAPLSQRMTGQIALGLVIVEGQQSHLEFSTPEQTKVVAEVQNGLSFLADQSPAKDVTFHHEIQILTVDVPEVSQGSTFEDFEAPWRDAALAQLGFPAGFSGVRAYAKHLRSTLQTDWAYVAFFTKYTLKHFAYAIPGGPKLVMHFDNDNWGPDQIDRVFAHETGHIFNAPDEYGTSNCNCGGSWGFFNRPNSNCALCATDGGVKCIMRSNDWSMCSETPYHLGYNGLPPLSSVSMGV